MEYGSFRANDDGLDLIPSFMNKNNSSKTVVNPLDIEVKNIVETGRGVALLGDDDKVVAELGYKYAGGKIDVNINDEALKELRNKRKKVQEIKKAKRTFELQKSFKRGFAVGLITALIGVGAIGYAGYNLQQDIKANRAETVSIVDVADVALEGLNSSEIEVVMAWLDYAMAGYSDTVNNSEYSDYVRPQYERDYQDHFAPAWSAYTKMLEAQEEVAAGMPQEFVASSISNNRQIVYSQANEINNIVSQRYQFDSTPYKYAIVIDGQIYIPLASIQNSGYTMDNLPEGTQIIDGVLYCPDSILTEVSHKIKM